MENDDPAMPTRSRSNSACLPRSRWRSCAERRARKVQADIAVTQAAGPRRTRHAPPLLPTPRPSSLRGEAEASATGKARGDARFGDNPGLVLTDPWRARGTAKLLSTYGYRGARHRCSTLGCPLMSVFDRLEQKKKPKAPPIIAIYGTCWRCARPVLPPSSPTPSTSSWMARSRRKALTLTSTTPSKSVPVRTFCVVFSGFPHRGTRPQDAHHRLCSTRSSRWCGPRPAPCNGWETIDSNDKGSPTAFGKGLPRRRCRVGRDPRGA